VDIQLIFKSEKMEEIEYKVGKNKNTKSYPNFKLIYLMATGFNFYFIT